MPHLLKISKYLLGKVPLKNFSHIMYPTLPHLASYVAQPWGTPPKYGGKGGQGRFPGLKPGLYHCLPLFLVIGNRLVVLLLRGP